MLFLFIRQVIQTCCNKFTISFGISDNGKELLCMNEVLKYLLTSAKPLLETQNLAQYLKYEKHEWQKVVDGVRGMIITNPGMVSLLHCLLCVCTLILCYT